MILNPVHCVGVGRLLGADAPQAEALVEPREVQEVLWSLSGPGVLRVEELVLEHVLGGEAALGVGDSAAVGSVAGQRDDLLLPEDSLGLLLG